MFDNFIMKAWVFAAHIRSSDSSFHPRVDIILVGVEGAYVADERHGLRDQPGVSLVRNFLN